MRGRSSWGRLYNRDKAAALRELEEVLTRYDGNICRVTHELNFARRHFYRIANRDADIVLPMIDRIRTAAIERIAARRRMLSGDTHGPR